MAKQRIGAQRFWKLKTTQQRKALRSMSKSALSSVGSDALGRGGIVKRGGGLTKVPSIWNHIRAEQARRSGAGGGTKKSGWARWRARGGGKGKKLGGGMRLGGRRR
jgi:hypothetical protein